MTFSCVVHAIRRRWYIPLVAVVGALAVFLLLARDSNIFTTRTSVSFLLPPGVSLLPENGTDDESIIAFAGVVAGELNQVHFGPRYASQDAPFYGAGLRQGVLVGVTDVGGQWTNNFSRAEIEIHIVGRDPEWVRETQQVILRQVDEITRRQQAEWADPDTKILTVVEPLTTRIYEVSPTRSSQAIAFLALFIAAVISGSWLAVLVEDIVRTRKREEIVSTATTSVRGVER